MKKLLLAFVFGAFALTSHAQQHYVGGDISLLPTYEANGAWYMDGNNERITDMLGYLKAQGLNSLRVRLFVDPSKATADEKGQGVRQDLEYVKTLGQRIKPPVSPCCSTSTTATPGPTRNSRLRPSPGRD